MEGCKALSKAVSTNCTLRYLDLTCNRIDKKCLDILLKGLRKNESLFTFKVSPCKYFLFKRRNATYIKNVPQNILIYVQDLDTPALSRIVLFTNKFMLSDWEKSHWKGRRNCYYQCTGTHTFTTNQTFGHNCKFECTKFSFSFQGISQKIICSLFLFKCNKSGDLFLSIKCSSSLKLTSFHCQGQSVNKEFMTSLERSPVNTTFTH